MGGGQIYETASSGGRHSGQLRQFQSQSSKQLEKSIRSFEKNIIKHENWIQDPSSKVKNWHSFSSDHQKNLIHHWREDIARAKELRELAQEVCKQNF